VIGAVEIARITSSGRAAAAGTEDENTGHEDRDDAGDAGSENSGHGRFCGEGHNFQAPAGTIAWL